MECSGVERTCKKLVVSSKELKCLLEERGKQQGGDRTEDERGPLIFKWLRL